MKYLEQGRTAELLLLKTIHSHMHVEENVDPVGNENSVVHGAQAL